MVGTHGEVVGGGGNCYWLWGGGGTEWGGPLLGRWEWGWCERDSGVNETPPTNPIVPEPLFAPPPPEDVEARDDDMPATQVVAEWCKDPSLCGPSPSRRLPDAPASLASGGAQAAEAPSPSPASNTSPGAATSPAPVSGAAPSPPPPPLAEVEAPAQLGTIGHPAPASAVDGPSLVPGAAATTTSRRRRTRYIPGADGGPPAPIPAVAIVPAPVFIAAPAPNLVADAAQGEAEGSKGGRESGFVWMV